MLRQGWRNSISTARLASWLISIILQQVISSPLTRPFCANTTSNVIRIRRSCLRKNRKKTYERVSHISNTKDQRIKGSKDQKELSSLPPLTLCPFVLGRSLISILFRH